MKLRVYLIVAVAGFVAACGDPNYPVDSTPVTPPPDEVSQDVIRVTSKTKTKVLRVDIKIPDGATYYRLNFPYVGGVASVFNVKKNELNVVSILPVERTHSVTIPMPLGIFSPDDIRVEAYGVSESAGPVVVDVAIDVEKK